MTGTNDIDDDRATQHGDSHKEPWTLHKHCSDHGWVPRCLPSGCLVQGSKKSKWCSGAVMISNPLLHPTV